jgi:hypothetical protein
MATRIAIERLRSRISELGERVGGVVNIVVFRGETDAFALARHLELRPDHLGRQASFERRLEERTEWAELAGCHSVAEIKAIMDEIGRGVGEGRSFLDFENEAA